MQRQEIDFIFIKQVCYFGRVIDATVPLQLQLIITSGHRSRPFLLLSILRIPLLNLIKVLSNIEGTIVVKSDFEKTIVTKLAVLFVDFSHETAMKTMISSIEHDKAPPIVYSLLF